MWRVPREAWGEYETKGAVLPLDIDAEVERFGRQGLTVVSPLQSSTARTLIRQTASPVSTFVPERRCHFSWPSFDTQHRNRLRDKVVRLDRQERRAPSFAR